MCHGMGHNCLTAGKVRLSVTKRAGETGSGDSEGNFVAEHPSAEALPACTLAVTEGVPGVGQGMWSAVSGGVAAVWGGLSVTGLGKADSWVGVRRLS